MKTGKTELFMLTPRILFAQLNKLHDCSVMGIIRSYIININIRLVTTDRYRYVF